MSTSAPRPRTVRFETAPVEPSNDSTLDQFVAHQVDRSIRQVILSATAEIRQVTRRHLAAASTGASAGWAVWSYPMTAAPIAIAVIVYWIISSK
ncbi:hypothetical protein ACFW0V_30925 [Micromonospora parva]|uniref:hypothetical protein n=1 Tax=Micromonospora parva TaxID=1464048 RepID=UPI0036723FF9